MLIDHNSCAHDRSLPPSLLQRLHHDDCSADPSGWQGLVNKQLGQAELKGGPAIQRSSARAGDSLPDLALCHVRADLAHKRHEQAPGGHAFGEEQKLAPPKSAWRRPQPRRATRYPQATRPIVWRLLSPAHPFASKEPASKPIQESRSAVLQQRIPTYNQVLDHLQRRGATAPSEYLTSFS